MANTTDSAIQNQQLYNDYVLRGFVQTIAPLRSFSFDVSPLPAQKGQTVNLTFISSGSAAQTYSDSTGYAMQNATRTLISVPLTNHKFVATYLSDLEVANSSLMRITDQGMANGRELGLAVVQDCISAITGSSFPYSYNKSSSSLWTVDSLVAVRKVASQLAWGLTRNVILNVNAYGGLLNDDDLKYIYRGSTGVVETGAIQNVFGWNNIYEANGYPTNLNSGSNTQVGIAATPDALAVAVRYLQPQANNVVESYPLTDKDTGITIGFRKWYDPDFGVTRTVFECVWGKAVGNPKAAINLTSTNDAL